MTDFTQEAYPDHAETTDLFSGFDQQVRESLRVSDVRHLSAIRRFLVERKDDFDGVHAVNN